MKISYGINGRFGNNLFQYLAMKLIQFELSKRNRIYEYFFNIVPENSFTINDDNYLDILESLQGERSVTVYVESPKDVENVDIIPLDKNIHLSGYFQFDKHIIKNKEYITSILKQENIEQINEKYTVSLFAFKINNFERRFRDDEVVLHLRLDDFIGDKVCMHYNAYFYIFATLPNTIKKVTIVVDKCKEQWELEYLNIIYMLCMSRNLEIQIESGGELLDDFCKLYYSKNFVSSNSTFSYLAGLLGTHEKSWCPSNRKRYPHQKIEKFNENTQTVEIEYL
jgi:hypothetical protein